MSSRFSYIKYDDERVKKQNALRTSCEAVETEVDKKNPDRKRLNGLLDALDLEATELAHGRPKDRVLRKLALLRVLGDALGNDEQRATFYDTLEEAYMWMGKSIRDEQISANGVAQEMPERGE